MLTHKPDHSTPLSPVWCVVLYKTNPDLHRSVKNALMLRSVVCFAEIDKSTYHCMFYKKNVLVL